MSILSHLVETDSDSRRELLRPQLVRLRQQTIDHPTAKDAKTVLCGQRALRVSASEWASIIQAFKDVGTGRNCCHLLAEAIALEMRSAERGVSVEDLGLGLALARDMAAARRALLQARSTDRAELVEESSARLDRLVRYLQAELKPEDRQRAQMLSDRLEQEQGSLLAPRGSQRKTAEPVTQKASTPTRAAVSKLPRRWRAWAVVGACALVALLLANTIGGETKSARLTRDDIAELPGVASVTPRTPVLYVTLKSAQWTKSKIESRRSLLSQIANKAQAAGFEQAQFSTDDGQVVGRWAEGEDAELF